MDTLNDIWKEVLALCKQEVSDVMYSMWLSPLVFYKLDADTAVFTVNAEYKKNIILTKFAPLIKKNFKEIIGFDVEIDVIVDSAVSEKNTDYVSVKEENKNTQTEDNENAPSENAKKSSASFTFDNFVVGKSNLFAYTVAKGVAESPGNQYNPLLIYGNSGLGKTHLLYAITNRMKKRSPDIKIVYIKGDDFTNQMIEALAQQKMNEFHERYRSCDVLLIDDIQFIAGKIATQEEFFHTFNALYEERKQIILTSDRPPRDIKTLEDRLKTRFEMGLIADIQPPDVELRTAIIKKKAEQVNIVVPDEVLVYLAENLRSNIRQLEVAIKKLAALSFLSGKPITMETAEGCISELLGGAEPVSVTVDKIFAVVYKKYGISREEIAGKSREKEIVAARHVVHYLIRRVTEMSYPNISKLTNRNHATIMSSMEAINKKLVSSPGFAIEIKNLIKDITGEESDD